MSGGVGGAKGSEKGSVSSPGAGSLMEWAEQLMNESSGARGGLLEAMQEIFLTGGSSLPIISGAVEQSRKASSRALEETDRNLATSGLAGTPHGEEIRVNQMQEGEQAGTKIQEQLVKSILTMVPGFIGNQTQTAMGGFANSIPGMQSTSGSAKAMSGNAGSK